MIFLAPQGDRVHSLDEMGSSIWEMVDGDRNLAEILEKICGEYEVETSVAEADLLIFMDGLLIKELISFKE